MIYDMYARVATSAGAMEHARADTAVVYILTVCIVIF